MDLKGRVRLYLEQRGIDKTHWQFYLEQINPDALANPDAITDEQIHHEIMAKELFWGLGDALLNYVQWERNQI